MTKAVNLSFTNCV